MPRKVTHSGCNFPTCGAVLGFSGTALQKSHGRNHPMTIVVTGATGNVGRPLVAELAAAGARVRAVTRRPKTAGFPSRVEVVASATDALAGASAVFLNSRALGEQLPEVVDACVGAGVTKLVA